MALPLMSSRVARAVPEKREKIRQLVSFKIGKEDFGLDILMVREIIRLQGITPIPNAPGFILGVINLRGSIIPVMDLRQRLMIPGNEQAEGGRKTRILILELGSYLTGFIVDAVPGIVRVAESEIEPTPELVVSNVDAEYILGVIKLPGRLVILLDFAKILKPREKKELDELQESASYGQIE